MTDMRAPDTFSSRMKGYEAVSQPILMQRTPVIVRVDGKNFSRLTRSMNKPFDQRLTQCMEAVALRLAAEAQNCRLAYFQSDEVSLLLTDFRTLTSEGWFGNQVQKICSISAAIATSAFAEAYVRAFPDRVQEGHFPVFDARCFNLPREEVANYFVWRQRDAERNSVAMAAQAQFSHKELVGVNRSGMMDALMLKKGINWNDYAAVHKRGAVVTKNIIRTNVMDDIVRSKWTASDAPIFTQDRDFVEKFLREEEVRV